METFLCLSAISDKLIGQPQNIATNFESLQVVADTDANCVN